MFETWLLELLKGIGKFFLNPLFYYGLFFTYILGSMRIKRERLDFHVRVEAPLLEMKEYLIPGLLAGLVLSVIAGGIGLNVPFGFIFIAAALALLASATLKARFLSPAYIIGLAFFVMIILHEYPIESFSPFVFEQSVYPSIALLAGLLLVVEGWLIIQRGALQPSPLLEKGKRGLVVGAQESKRVWLVPILLFIPEGILSVPGDWWPVFSFGDTTWSPILVPFFIGFSLKVRSKLIEQAVRPIGKQVIALGLIVSVIAVLGLWYPFVSIGAMALAIVGREAIHYLFKNKEEKVISYFSARTNGLLILGVLPDSPAHRMGLKAGELVTRVNGKAVTNSSKFYSAVQSNRAYCKLEVFDTNEQIRLVQRALYEGDHHELGILAVESEKPL